MAHMTLEELELQIKGLKEMEEKTPAIFKKLDSEFWMICAMKELYDMCKEYNQTEVPDFSKNEIVPVKRIIKAETFISDIELRRYGVDSTTFCGLFLAVDGFMVSERLMKEVFHRLINRCLTPDVLTCERHGLPDLRYETIRTVPSTGTGFLLADTEFNEVFESWNSYRYLDLA